MASRKVILLVDGAKSHSWSNLNLHNTTVHCLPPNTTSRLQPMDASIIMSFKHRYHSYFIKWLLNQYKCGKDNKMNVLTAIKYIACAWREILSETVHNCFKHIGILPVIQDNEELVSNYNDDELIKELHMDIEALCLQNVMDLDNFINYPEESDTTEILTDQKILNLTTSVVPEKN
ncbi:14214_t:CDS:1 [Cetraspora pellucida]|uniref:14214_t:CDS:1 n=1 Tax=Cetraspora pellucida TaxID=1433469 RepID=A0A9N9EGG3_9GLOM|nr:14214_t:CDS:1 [Cetraspora pellucida]